jgi:hypothetical protein
MGAVQATCYSSWNRGATRVITELKYSARNLHIPAAKCNLYQRITFSVSRTLVHALTNTVSSRVYDKHSFAKHSNFTITALFC